MTQPRVIKPDTHGPWYECPGGHYYGSCMWCDGGLSYCETCGAFEGATPDECPGKPMEIFSDLVYKGIVNFRDGYWRGECAQVMRPVYDLDNYMAEAGYIRDGVNNAGNPKWIQIEEYPYKDEQFDDAIAEHGDGF